MLTAMVATSSSLFTTLCKRWTTASRAWLERACRNVEGPRQVDGSSLRPLGNKHDPGRDHHALELRLSRRCAGKSRPRQVACAQFVDELLDESNHAEGVAGPVGLWVGGCRANPESFGSVRPPTPEAFAKGMVDVYGDEAT